MYTREIEIRKLSSVDVCKLAQILDLNDSWKKLMRIIPKNAFSDSPEDIKCYKYNLDHERLIENASLNPQRMAAEILLDEWGTSGRKRPTLGILLELLVRAELFRAADLVAIDYLNEPPPARPSKGPAAKIDISIPLDSEFMHSVENMLQNGDYPGTETLNDNAKSSRLADNNKDYCEKYRPRKKIDVPSQSNGIGAQTQSSVDNNSEAHAVHPHSDLMKFTSPMQSESNNSSSAFGEQLSIDLPNLSVLNTPSSLADIIPNLSVLNVNDVTQPDTSPNTNLKTPDEMLSPMQSSPSVSTISSSPDEDDDDISAPNLSILDQRSSNNDSSLTNVTATSEDNSFEMSLNEGSTSYDNIPCLSVLKST